MRKLIIIVLILLLPAIAFAAGDCNLKWTFTWQGKIDSRNRIVITGLTPEPVCKPMTCLNPEVDGDVHKYQVDDLSPCDLPDGEYSVTAHIVNAWGVKGEESQAYPISKDTTPPSAPTGFEFVLE